MGRAAQLALTAVCIASPAAAQEDMLLTCEGTAVNAITVSETTARVTGSDGDSVKGEAETRRSVPVPFTVRFETEGGTARINLPAALAIGGSGSYAGGGWYKVTNLSVGENRITGDVKHGGFFGWSFSFEIDRRIGVITSDAGFEGQCSKADLSQRAF